MAEHVSRRRERRKHRSTSKKVRMVLLSVGVVGLIIGILLFLVSFRAGTAKLRLFGIIYVVVSLFLLGLRPVVEQMSHSERRRQRRRHVHGPDGDPARSVAPVRDVSVPSSSPDS